MAMTDLTLRKQRGLMRGETEGFDFCHECGRWHALDDCPEPDRDRGKEGGLN